MSKELIDKLSALPSDYLVLVEGYEGGLCDIQEIRAVTVELNVHPEEFYGPHEESPQGTVKAIVLTRKQNPLA